MNYYNVYRPRAFAEVLGQEHITSILKRQSIANQFSHSYCFYGPSGSGKTSTARILAMALNCLNLKDGEPCGECPSCQAIIDGRHWDVQEIDGARFRGIDSIKELCYRAYFAPMGKCKVYIIDECHMLTPEAWAAMLKLIEEPPPSLCIILCTTNREAIPDTIVSRCQEYPFDGIKPEAIMQKLKLICQRENLKHEEITISTIAQMSLGNLRAAENRLQQMC